MSRTIVRDQRPWIAMIQRCRPPWLRAPSATPAMATATSKMTMSERVRIKVSVCFLYCSWGPTPHSLAIGDFRFARVAGAFPFTALMLNGA